MARMTLKNKGIMSFNYVLMIMRIIFLVIVLIICVMLVSIFLNQKFNTSDIHSEILIDGLIYGTGGISYTDPVTGRIYPGMIALEQLNESKLSQGLFHPENHMISAKIVVGRDAEPEIKTVYYNKEWYDNWEPLSRLKLGGIGGLALYERKLPVTIMQDGELKSGFVDIEVIQPTSVSVK